MTEQGWKSDFEELTSRHCFRLIPQVNRVAENIWQASYPGLNWSVNADSEQSAIEKLQAEDLRRTREEPDDYWSMFTAVIQRHLHKPISGVQMIERSEYERITGGLDPESELERAFRESDAGATG